MLLPFATGVASAMDAVGGNTFQDVLKGHEVTLHVPCCPSGPFSKTGVVEKDSKKEKRLKFRARCIGSA